jgi:hypothetical protein
VDKIPGVRYGGGMSRGSIVAIAAWVLLADAQAFGHHSFAAEFDAKTPRTLSGTIVKLEWTNPHCHLWIDVQTAEGAVERWGLEMSPPGALSRMAIHREMFIPGDAITATVFPARDGRRVGAAMTFVLKNGRTIEVRSRG